MVCLTMGITGHSCGHTRERGETMKNDKNTSKDDTIGGVQVHAGVRRMSENKCCDACRNFKTKEANGNGWCVYFNTQEWFKDGKDCQAFVEDGGGSEHK